MGLKLKCRVVKGPVRQVRKNSLFFSIEKYLRFAHSLTRNDCVLLILPNFTNLLLLRFSNLFYYPSDSPNFWMSRIWFLSWGKNSTLASLRWAALLFHSFLSNAFCFSFYFTYIRLDLHMGSANFNESGILLAF